MLSEKEIISYAEKMKQTERWDWTAKTALVLTGIWNLYEAYNHEGCRETVKDAMDQLVQDLKDQGSEMINFAVLGCGRHLFPLYRENGEEIYKKTACRLWQWIESRQDAVLEGPWTENLFLAEPFILEYENQFRGKEGYHQIQKQLADANRMAAEQLPGMDQETSGYYLMALIDSSSLISEEVFDHYKNAEKYFKAGLKLVNDRTSPYAVYSVLKGCRLGALLAEKYQVAAEQSLPDHEALTDECAGIMLMAYGEYAKLHGKDAGCSSVDQSAAKAAD